MNDRSDPQLPIGAPPPRRTYLCSRCDPVATRTRFPLDSTGVRTLVALLIVLSVALLVAFACNQPPTPAQLEAGAALACDVGEAFVGNDALGPVCARQAEIARGIAHAMELFQVDGKPDDPATVHRAVCACIREAKAQRDAGP